MAALAFVFCTGGAVAQDNMPQRPAPDTTLTANRELRMLKDTLKTVPVALPACFEGVQPNIITGDSTALFPVLEQLRLMRLGIATDTLRILHIGDSHVRGRIFPNTVADSMAATFGAVQYTNFGVNGATVLTFTHADRVKEIVQRQPQLLVLSFGTNESHNRRYNPTVHYRQIQELVSQLSNELPGVPMLLTTPPGAYERVRRNRRRTYNINPRTAAAADVIMRFGREHDMAVWDMYNIMGGSSRACLNWKQAELMRPDHVHYLPEAYALQGELLFQAIVNAYNAYANH